MTPIYQPDAATQMTATMWIISLAVFAFVIVAGILAVKVSDRPDPQAVDHTTPASPALTGQHEKLPAVGPRGRRRIREVYDRAFDTAVLLDSFRYPLADRAIAVVMSLGHQTNQQLNQLESHEFDLLAFAGALRSYVQDLPGSVDQLELALSKLEPRLGLLVH